MLQSFNMLIDAESKKLQQVAAEIHEETFEETVLAVMNQVGCSK